MKFARPVKYVSQKSLDQLGVLQTFMSNRDPSVTNRSCFIWIRPITYTPQCGVMLPDFQYTVYVYQITGILCSKLLCV